VGISVIFLRVCGDGRGVYSRLGFCFFTEHFLDWYASFIVSLSLFAGGLSEGDGMDHEATTSVEFTNSDASESCVPSVF
jgi:hypothetical protein